MALVQFTDINKISGSIGGTTYFQTKHGIGARAKTMPIDPNTPLQQSIRAGMGIGSANWNEMPEEQRQDWRDYAAGLTRISRVGTVYQPSGRNLQIGFQSFAENVRALGFLGSIEPKDLFPTIPGEMAPITVAVNPPALPGTGFDVKVTNHDPLATLLCIVDVGIPVSATRVSYDGPWVRARVQGTDLPASGVINVAFDSYDAGQRIPVRVRTGCLLQSTGHAGKMSQTVWEVAAVTTNP
jgi:hypothetical protein